jgi:hypothetical protein
VRGVEGGIESSEFRIQKSEFRMRLPRQPIVVRVRTASASGWSCPDLAAITCANVSTQRFGLS